MAISADQARAVQRRAECLYTGPQVEAALDRMAAGIAGALAGTDPIVLCVMNGGLMIAGGLMLRLDFPLRQDYLHVSRYRDETRGARLHWLARPRLPLQGESVLVVDDILDEGVTLQAVVDACREAGAARVRSAVLVRKRHARNIGIEADFVGLEVDDRYVFGYGLDYKGYLRNAAGIFAVTPSDTTA